MKMNIGQLIREGRVQHGLSQAELAAKVGVSQAAIGQWERGEFAPRGRNLNALVEVLGPGVDPTRIKTEQADGTIAFEGAIDASPTRASARLKLAEHRRKSLDFERELAALIGHSQERTRFNVHVDVPSRTWTLDIVTPLSLIEICHPLSHNDAENEAIRTLWKLTVIRSHLADKRNAIAVVRLPLLVEKHGFEDAFAAAAFYDQTLARVANDASLIGLEIVVAETAAEAASAIFDIEDRSK